ncbi:sodium:solute symporter [candidate division KSB1 bacterium]|nr:sodium:solute symporter [candidate division KSB1 bacterium]
MNEPTFFSIFPPVIAIFLAILTRQVFLSLFIGIWMGWMIHLFDLQKFLLIRLQVAQFFNSSSDSLFIQIISLLWGVIKIILQSIAQTLEALVKVFADAGNTKVIIFSALVGALITFTQYSGGMEGFINWITTKKLIRTRRGAGLLAWAVGMIIFIESSICVLITGAIARPLFDKFKISREKLAYIADSTSAPKCVLIPLNAWGAFIIALLSAQGVEQGWKIMLLAIPLNFYAWIAILLVLGVVLLQKDLGPMRQAEKRVQVEGKLLRDGAEPLVSSEVITVEKKSGIPARTINMLLPILMMVVMMPLGLVITGNGDFTQGSGSTAVLWAVFSALLAAGVSYRLQGIMSITEIMEQFMKGISGLMPLALLMLMAFAIGDVCKILGTGQYVANLAKSWLIPQLVPAVLFIISCFIAFATGTSWGTFAMMIPIAVPTAQLIGLPLAPTVAAVLGGGVFGDHCSPISDTTIIASMAAATDHIDHVRTQLPYALLAAGLALGLYLIIGIFYN